MRWLPVISSSWWSGLCGIIFHLEYGPDLGFPGGSVVKNSPRMREMQETMVQFLGQKDPLEKDMATTSSILAWRIPWTEEPGRLQSIGLKRVRQD